MSEEKTYRLVVKLGTNVLTNTSGQLDIAVIKGIVSQVAQLKKDGHQIIMVSSGAVGAGMSQYNLHIEQDEAVKRQIYSAIGQVKLMNTYAEQFEQFGLVCAQVLATKEDFTGKEHYDNMKNCMIGLLQDDIIPIVNENDVVSLTELMFTDNDELAGLMAYMIRANKLALLTNVDGIFTENGNTDTFLIEEVPLGDPSVYDHILASKSTGGRGGMKSKVDIATRAAEKGIETYIANGRSANVLQQILDGDKIGTRFLAP